MENAQEFRYFDAIDYTVFVLQLVFSALIGIYFAFFAKEKQNTIAVYLFGGRKMGIFPISMSLIISYVSGITLLGLPSEMYVYGTQFLALIVAELVTAVVISYVFIPVFYSLQVTSSYEYLNKRFNPTVRTLGSVLFLLKMILYIPIVIYVPALAFSQVSGFNLEVIIPVTCVVCIFYTTLGGIKAVVWTDTLQFFLMIGGILVVNIMGTIDVGGFRNVYQRNLDSGRIDFFNTSWDPTIRHTLWNVLIGKFFSHLGGCTTKQAMVQRCLAMPTLRKARLTIMMFAFGTAFLVCICCYSGVLIYAAFYDCDPISAGTVGKADQLLPYFVMKITNNVPGLPGIFVSGVFSASLSTMATGLNSMCGVILEDFIRPLRKKPLSEGQASFYMKIITIIVGTICTLLAFVVDKLGGIIQASGTLGAITAGTLLGMFSLGMLFPWANSSGAIAGGVSAAALVSWLSVGSQIAIHTKRLVFPTKPVTVEGCDNATLAEYFIREANRNMITPEPAESPFVLFTISYVYFTLIGVVTVIVVGLIVSFATGVNDYSKMDINVFSPVIHGFVRPRQQKVKGLKNNDKNYGIDPPITSSPDQVKPLLIDNDSPR